MTKDGHIALRNGPREHIRDIEGPGVDDITEGGTVTWMRRAQERSRWNNDGEAFLQTAVDGET